MPESLVHPKERLYFIIAMTFSVLVYVLLLVSIVFVFYVPFVIAAFIVSQGLLLGRIRGGAVRVTPAQFPDLYAMAESAAGRMGLATMPAIYVVQEGGFLNAFALRFIGRDFMVVYSELYAVAKQRGEAEVAFVVAHEMAHLVRRHTFRKALIAPANFVPFLGVAYSRACEYTADAMGTYVAPGGAASGILLLAAGPELFRHVDGNAFISQAADDVDFFVILAEKLATHPTLPNRLVAIARQLASPPAPGATAAVAGGSAIATR